jgi:hypothetical protein
MKHLQAVSEIEVQEKSGVTVHNEKGDDVELFANDPYLYGNYSY